MESGGVQVQNMPDVKLLGKIPKSKIMTPFGHPASDVSILRVRDVLVATLLRHGRGHIFPPHRVPYRANAWTLAALGQDVVVQYTAVGALSSEIKPGDIAIVTKLRDETRRPPPDLLEDIDVAIHPSLASQTCSWLPEVAVEAFHSTEANNVHPDASHVTIAGPAFAPIFETKDWCEQGIDLIGMTSVRVALLYRQLRLHWLEIAIPTDSDSGNVDEEDVSAGLVSRRMKEMEGVINSGFCNLVELLAKKGSEHDDFCTCKWEVEEVNMSKEVPKTARQRLLLPPYEKLLNWSRLIS